MRLRTLPVSAAGVITAWAFALWSGTFKVVPAVICLLFALLAQIASNFANEYFDFRDGLDRPGRVGPRRGVTEGDITPRAMLIATAVTVALACCLGLSLLFYGPWWLLIVGILVVVGVYAYSAGPYPLSRHALGEVAVVVFFGIVPVNFTYYLMAGTFNATVFNASLAIGLMGANILLVNNYRDIDDDRSVGKHTLATRFGASFASALYLINGWVAMALLGALFSTLPIYCAVAPIIYLTIHTLLWIALLQRKGTALNPLLGITALNMLLFSLTLLILFL